MMDRQLAASVQPQLEYSFSNLDEDGRPTIVGFSVQNSGVGPLRIRSFRSDYNGWAIHDGGDLLAAACAARVDTARLARERLPIRRRYMANRVVGAGVRIDFLRFSRDAAWAKVLARLENAVLRVSTRVCSCFVLDDCWVSGSREPEPVPARSCVDERKARQYR